MGDKGGLGEGRGGEGRLLGGGWALVVQIKALYLSPGPEWSLNGRGVGRTQVMGWIEKMGREQGQMDKGLDRSP